MADSSTSFTISSAVTLFGEICNCRFFVFGASFSPLLQSPEVTSLIFRLSLPRCTDSSLSTLELRDILLPSSSSNVSVRNEEHVEHFICESTMTEKQVGHFCCACICSKLLCSFKTGFSTLLSLSRMVVFSVPATVAATP